jgi:dipeptidyl-peptidase-4
MSFFSRIPSIVARMAWCSVPAIALTCAASTVEAGGTAGADRSACDMDCVLDRAEAIRSNGGEAAALMRQAAPAISGPHWLSDDGRFWYAMEAPTDVVVKVVDPRRRTQTVAAKVSELARASAENGGPPIDPLAVAVDDVSYLARSGGLEVVADGQRLRFDPRNRDFTRQPVERERPGRAISPDGRYQIYAREHNLYVEDAAGSSRQLTTDGVEWYSFAGEAAQSNPVMGRAVAPEAPHVRWIGNGPSFYLERWDFRRVNELYHVDNLSTPPRLLRQRMAFPGDREIPVPEIWIFDAEHATGIRIAADGWAYLGNMDVDSGGIYPSRDGRSLYFARMDRGYTKVELCVADVATGAVRVLLREERPRHFSVRNVEFHEISSGFLWKSDADGYPHYYLHDSSGRRARQLTRGPFAVGEILRVDERRAELLFRGFGDASRENPAAQHLYRVSLRGGAVERLDREPGHHVPSLSPDGSFVVDVFSDIDAAPRMVLRGRDGRIVMSLEQGDVRPMLDAGWRMPVPFRVMATDGKTPLYGAMWLPFDLDPQERYPIIVNVYPGPSQENAPFDFEPGGSPGALAQLGFIVVRVGQRGGNWYRGVEYQDYPFDFGNARDFSLADNKATLEQLAERHAYVDISRAGVFGHSGGGFSAMSAMLKYPEFYQAGVASSGNHDLNVYEMNSSEFHFGDPRNGPLGGPRGYASNMTDAARLRARVLFIHGDVDDDVALLQSLRMMKALQDAGKDYDTLIVPGMAHPYPPRLQPYIWRKIWKHFRVNLQGEDPRPVTLAPPAMGGAEP